MFVVGASLTVPYMTIILRKSYGLGAQAMAGGSHKAPLFTVSWPTGEFGGMGLEGAVKLGFRKELAAVEDPAQRKELFEHMVARAYEHGKALNTATHFEIDDVIDPAESASGSSARCAPRRHRRRTARSGRVWIRGEEPPPLPFRASEAIQLTSAVILGAQSCTSPSSRTGCARSHRVPALASL
jgi:hypothetical protein